MRTREKGVNMMKKLPHENYSALGQAACWSVCTASICGGFLKITVSLRKKKSLDLNQSPLI